MSPFIIFALALTFGYAIYFAVMITLDLQVKKDDQQNTEENFDLPENEPAVEEPKVITEQVKDGEEAGMTYTEQVDEDGLRLVNPTGNITLPSPQSELVSTTSSRDSSKINEEHEAYMEDIDPDAQQSFYSDELLEQINQKYKKRNITKINAIDHL